MDSKPYLTLVDYAGGHERDVAGHDEANGMAIWLHEPGTSTRPVAQIIVSTSDGPPDGRIIIDVKTSNPRVNVKAWGRTVCPGSPGQAGNAWTDNASYVGPLGKAIEKDHPCDDQACDIAYALESGFVATAAWLLTGATECSTVEAIAECLDLELRTLADEESEIWHDWHASHSVECDHCGSHNYADDVSDLSGAQCGNCSARLVVVPEDDHAEPDMTYMEWASDPE